MIRSAATLQTGLAKHATLPLTHTPRPALDDAIEAARRLGRDFARARVATRKARRQRSNVASLAQAHAVLCRQILVPALGSAWSTEWIPLGWDQNTLSVPPSSESLAELYQSLTAHLGDHPELVSDKYKVTAVECQKHLDALEAAIDGLADARSKQRAARELREAGDLKLVETEAALVKELELILKPGDARWIDFVKEVPADEVRPDGAEDLVVEEGAPGELDADWEPSARAERYLVYVKVAGVDTEFRRLLTVQDEAATLTGLPPGKQVTVYVVAANAAGESAPTEQVTAHVPALAKAA